MEEVILQKNDELVMKLLHYFLVDEGYNPVILHGAKDEIWLENLDGSYKIIRIVSNYIHNNDQLDFDLYRTKQIVKRIKKKTLAFHMNVLSIFVNLGENVNLEEDQMFDQIACVNLKNMKDLKNYHTVIDYFPDICKKTTFQEKGMNLFMKVTESINQKSEQEAKKSEDVFKMKKPIVTYLLILINVVVFAAMYIFGKGSTDSWTLYQFGAVVRESIVDGELWRLFTGAFLHIGIFHLLVNCYSLYLIGPQIENFFGKTKYLILYLGSAIGGNLLSMSFHTGICAGASGAIFGLLGALLYFGYHYRLYLGNVIKSQIIPLIILNLVLGFMSAGVDNAAHIAGLITGVLLSMAVGVKFKSTKMDKINGYILSAIFFGVLIYMAFFASIH